MKNVVFAKQQMWLGTDKKVCKCDQGGVWEMVYMVDQCFTLFAVTNIAGFLIPGNHVDYAATPHNFSVLRMHTDITRT